MEYLLKASAVIVIFYFCYNLFLQRDTFFKSNRWFLLFGLITAFCIPFIVIPKYIEQNSLSISEFIFTEVSTASNINSNTIDITQTLSVVYNLGLIFFFGRFLIQLYSLSLLLIKNKKQQYRHFTFVETLDDVSPFSFFKWIVYNPNQFSETELKQILNHEKVHARQWHSLDILISQLTSIILWFNPIIWLYKKNLQQNLEFIADHNANKKTDCKKSYQHLLLKTSLPNYQMALTNNFYNSLIKKRIVMLHKNRSKNRNYLKFTLILPLLALFIMSFNTKEIIANNNLIDTNEAITEVLESNGDIEMVLITKDFTDEDFNKIKSQFSKKGVTLKFKGIKRNDKGEITAIKVEASSKNANANFNTNSNDPIKPIKITIDSESNSISIGNGSKLHFGEGKGYSFMSKDGKHKIHKSGKGSNVFVYSSSDDEHDGEHEHDDKHENVFIIKKDSKVHKDKNVHVIRGDEDEIIEIKGDGKNKHKIFVSSGEGKVIREWISKEDEDENVWITDDEKAFKIKTIGKGNNKIFISGNGDKNPIFILDGKEVPKKVIDELDSDKIDKIEVLKGDAATKEYGKKAKDGVVVITTKN
jgi:bla regulator protein blaR1